MREPTEVCFKRAKRAPLSTRRESFADLVSNSTEFVDDGLVFLQAKVEQKGWVEVGFVRETVDPQNPSQLLPADLLLSRI